MLQAMVQNVAKPRFYHAFSNNETFKFRFLFYWKHIVMAGS